MGCYGGKGAEEKPLSKFLVKIQAFSRKWLRVGQKAWRLDKSAKLDLVSWAVAPLRISSSLASRTRHSESLDQAWDFDLGFAFPPFGVTMPGD